MRAMYLSFASMSNEQLESNLKVMAITVGGYRLNFTKKPICLTEYNYLKNENAAISLQNIVKGNQICSLDYNVQPNIIDRTRVVKLRLFAFLRDNFTMTEIILKTCYPRFDLV